jgi:hypothetical protein
MGSQTFTTRSNGEVIDESWYDVYREALSGALYPRQSSDGAPTDLGASLGTSSLRWKQLKAASGEYTAGAIKMRHSYNGLVLPSHGWMLCDGRQINKTNYDAEWGAGSWDAKIIASPIEDKFLPNMVDRYLIGAASVSQDGTIAITAVGSAGSLALTHNHQWYHSNGTGSSDDVVEYDNFEQFAGNLNHAAGVKTGGAKTLEVFESTTSAAQDPLPSAYTDNWTPDTRPESIKVLYYMRII